MRGSRVELICALYKSGIFVKAILDNIFNCNDQTGKCLHKIEVFKILDNSCLWWQSFSLRRRGNSIIVGAYFLTTTRCV